MPDQPSPKTASPEPTENRVAMQANAINVGGDMVARDKITHNITNIIHKAFLGGANEERDRRNRRIMLDKVRTFWVKGVLEQSLHGAALIELGMEYKPDAVQYPWNTVLQRPDRSPQPLPHGAKMIEVFDQEGGELLILGAPGSGKTTMLLDLARDLITRAEEDETLPIPVVFNLSSWAEKHPPLAEWLIEELSFRYDVPKKVGKTWIEKDQVLPLLDGLDEVKLEQRTACVEAVNNFRKEHLVHLAVCSRRAEYEALRAQLRLQSAVVLQSLTRKQIDAYLQSAGEELTSVRTVIQHNDELQWLAKSPLMLSIMVLAYQGLDISNIPALGSAEKQRKNLFDAYIQRMFERRGADKRYTLQQVTRWLSWLAQRMMEHRQVTFYLERMQLDWLSGLVTRLFYILIANLIIGLVSGLVGGLVGLLVLGVNFGPLGGALMGSELGLAAGLVVELIGGFKINVVETLRWSWNDTKDRLGHRLINRLMFGLVVGLVFGLIIGLLRELFIIKRLEGVQVVRALPGWLFFGVITGLSGGLVGGLLAGLFGGLKIGDEIETKTVPNEGIWRSAGNAVLVGISGIVFGTIAGLVNEQLGFPLLHKASGILNVGLAGMLFFGLFFGQFFGVSIALVGGLGFGGRACIQYAALCLMLYRNGSAPLNYVRFLDYCAERIFLRKVGGGYIFIHRFLMEHFASLTHEPMWGDEIKRAAANILPEWVLGAMLSTGIIRKWLASVYAFDGRRGDRSGDVEQAFLSYAEAVALVPNDPGYLNSYCWFGSLSGHADEVMDTGERAVELAPDKGWIRDTRGLARALTGNYLGAIEDFKFYVERLRENDRSEETRIKRESWITELEAGRNPFNEEILKELVTD